jgi:hypothetical protein
LDSRYRLVYLTSLYILALTESIKSEKETPGNKQANLELANPRITNLIFSFFLDAWYWANKIYSKSQFLHP